MGEARAQCQAKGPAAAGPLDQLDDSHSLALESSGTVWAWIYNGKWANRLRRTTGRSVARVRPSRLAWAPVCELLRSECLDLLVEPCCQLRIPAAQRGAGPVRDARQAPVRVVAPLTFLTL